MSESGGNVITLQGAAERDVVVLALQGDRDASGELVRRATPVVRDLLRRMGARPDVVDDLTQDALLTALSAITGFRGEASFTTWTARIAGRLYLRRLRRDARSILMAEPMAMHGPGPDAQHERQARLDLDRALEGLSASERLSVVLCHGAGLTHEEIAAATGAPLGTVKSHVLRGMKKLKALMAGET